MRTDIDQENTAKANPEQIGQLLCATILRVLESIPECSMKPTDISKKLGVSRTMVSRTISAIRKENPIETLTSLPGPESLRAIMHAAKVAGAFDEGVREALLPISLFADMIQKQYGTRAAFNADLSVRNDDAKNRYEQASRYQVYNGMSQMLGVQCKAWVSCAILAPNKDDPTMLDRSSVFGASGLRRLRPDMPTRLAIGLGPRDITVAFPDREMAGVRPSRRLIDINQYCAFPQAPTVTIDEGERVIEVFSPLMGDKESVYDLLSGAYVPNSVPLCVWPRLTRRGNIAAPDVPASMLNMDVLLHRDVVFGENPEAFVYNVGLTGTARYDSKNWELNRVASNAKIQDLGTGLQNIGINEVARYPDMVHHVCKEAGFDPSEFRAFRWRVEYPVFGFQYMLAFPVLKPEGE